MLRLLERRGQRLIQLPQVSSMIVLMCDSPHLHERGDVVSELQQRGALALGYERAIGRHARHGGRFPLGDGHNLIQLAPKLLVLARHY